jgi:hypothetical protein
MFILSKFTPFCTPPISVGHPFSEHWHLTWSASPACPYYSFYIQNCVSWDIYTLQNCSSFWFLFIICQPVHSGLINHQPTVLFSQNKPATSNQPAVLFSQNKPAPAIRHQPTEQAVEFCIVSSW